MHIFSGSRTTTKGSAGTSIWLPLTTVGPPSKLIKEGKWRWEQTQTWGLVECGDGLSLVLFVGLHIGFTENAFCRFKSKRIKVDADFFFAD
jgi:hypothetical protein